MSEEQLKAFLEAVKADAGLQQKLKGAGDADAVLAIAKEVGFAISAEELKSTQSEISEEELEGVAGGSRTFGYYSCYASQCNCPVLSVNLCSTFDGCNEHG